MDIQTASETRPGQAVLRQTDVDPLTRTASQLRGKVKTLQNLRAQGRITPTSFELMEGRVMAILTSAKLQIKALELEARARHDACDTPVAVR